MHNKDLAKSPPRVVIDTMPHKVSLDRDRANNFTKNSGLFSHHVDTRFGIDLDAFQALDMRTMR
jgi:hypothetical protein